MLVLKDRLEKAGIEVTEVIDHKLIHSIYFTDPNGIALEASVWITNPTGRDPDYADRYVFQDPDPVLALKEQMEGVWLVEAD